MARLKKLARVCERGVRQPLKLVTLVLELSPAYYRYSFHLLLYVPSDLATGLGSPNAANLSNQWKNVVFNSSNVTLNLSQNSGTGHGSNVTLSGTVSPGSGSGIPTGDVPLGGNLYWRLIYEAESKSYSLSIQKPSR